MKMKKSGMKKGGKKMTKMPPLKTSTKKRKGGKKMMNASSMMTYKL